MTLNEKDMSSLQPSWTLPISTISYVIVAVIVLIQIYIYYCDNFKSKKVVKLSRSEHNKNRILGWEDIKGPRPLLPTNLTGNIINLLPFSTSIEKSLAWAVKYPGLFKLTGAYKKYVVLTSPECIQQLFKSVDFGHNVKDVATYDLLKPFMSNGLIMSSGTLWQTQRKIMMQTQSFKSLKAYMGLLNRHSENFVQELGRLFEDGKTHEINTSINVVFLKVICEMITGYNSNISVEFNRYHHNMQVWKEAFMTRCLCPWLLSNFLWKFHPLSRRQEKSIQELFEFAKNRLKDHRDARAEAGSVINQSVSLETDSTTYDRTPFRCLLDELLDAGIDETQIVDEINTMLFAGHETVATAIHFLCFSLALNQNIQEECRKEVDELFQNGKSVTFEAAQSKLKYLERCIQEALRLYPPVFMTLRELQTPFPLKHENNEYLLPIGTTIIVGTLPTHRSADNFPDPLKFDPDRFLPEEAAKRHPCSFIPFSGGPRNCLGLKFAMIEMKVVMAHLLRHFVMETTDVIQNVQLLPLLTLTPANEFMFSFEKRTIL